MPSKSLAVPVPATLSEADVRAAALVAWGAYLTAQHVHASGPVEVRYLPHRPVTGTCTVETNGGTLPAPLTAASPVVVVTAAVA